MTARKTVTTMCCLTIGYKDYLMPMDKGMKVFELMQAAFECDERFDDRGYTYAPSEQPKLECKIVRREQIRTPVPEPEMRRLAR